MLFYYEVFSLMSLFFISKQLANLHAKDGSWFPAYR